MSRRANEIIAVALFTVFCVVIYMMKITGKMSGVKFSPAVSIAVIVLLGASLLIILVLTLRGRMVGRQVVFLYVAIAVSLPFFMSITQKIPISPEVQTLYDGMQDLKPGAKVLVSFDYDPPSAPELQPMAISFFKYCFEHDLKVIIMGLWPQGPLQANQALESLFDMPKYKDMHLKYGVDYVNLGFQTGNEFVIQRMGTSFRSMFATDYSGRNYDDIPLLKNVKNFSNIDYVFNLSAGYPGTVEWVQVAVDRYGVTLGAGNTAVQAPQCYPYLRSGQLKGILGGMNGAAEFEELTKTPGKGTQFMLSQSFAHMIVIAFIIIGNAAFIMSGRKSKLKG